MSSAAKHFDPQLGLDIHLTMMPPLPVPLPLPTPHIGLVLDPFDYLPFIGNQVHVDGVKSATAGTGGLDIHIPLGVWQPFTRMPGGPQLDDELFMGSMTVLNGGQPFSRQAMPVLDCNFIGMIPPLRVRKPKKPRLSLSLPTALNVAIPSSVDIGGPPTISLQAMAFKAAFKLVGKAAKGAAVAFRRLRQKVFKNMQPGFLKCKVLRAEPVDIRDGSVSVRHEDFAVPGRLALAWTRTYSSADLRAGACGPGWQTPADIRVEVDADGAVLFVDVERTAVFPHLPEGIGASHAVLELVDGARLTREATDQGEQWVVRVKEGWLYRFPVPTDRPLPATLPIGRIEDRCGNYWQFERIQGQLVRVVESGVADPAGGPPLQGRFLDVECRHGRIERIRLHDPATGLNHPLVSYRYDEAGDLVAAVDALEAARTFAYREHRMVRHTDRIGLSFHYAYDARWQVVRAWGDGGLYDYRFRYDALLNETGITDSLGHVWTVKFDANGLPLCEIDPLEGVTAFEYDEMGRTTAIVDPMGLRTEFEYDARGNLLKLTRPDGASFKTEYDDQDLPVAITDPGQARWCQVWNESGLLLRRIGPLGDSHRYEYGSGGDLRAHVDALGAVTRFDFDRHGQLREIIDPLGASRRYEHDGLGRLIRETDPAGQDTRYRYDARGRLLGIDQPGGSVHCQYDAEGQLVRYTDAAGFTTRLEYAGVGQIARRIQPDGHCVGYRYDTEERLVEVVNQCGETYRLMRDPLGRIVEEIDYWGQRRCYRYDPAGRLTGSTDPLGMTIVYDTDKLGRITRKTLPDHERPGHPFQESFRYDSAGRLIEFRNAHRQVKRRFDAAGRLREEVQDGFRISSAYDAAGRRILRETSAGNRVACAFDLRGQLVSVTINEQPSIRIECDALGRSVVEHLSPGLQRQLSYDDRGLLTAQAVLHEHSPLFETRYEYDRAGNLTRHRDSQHGEDAYSYDPVGQLLSHIDPKGRIVHFLNDPAGDRLKTRILQARMRRAGGGEPQPEEWSREGECDGLSYAFDRAGNLVRRGRAGGESFAATDELDLRWDAHHRLVESVSRGQRTSYGYDPLGRRVCKRGPTHTTWFFWDGDVLLGEVTHANEDPEAPRSREAGKAVDVLSMRGRMKAMAALHQRTREYVHYPSTFVPLAMIEKHGDSDSSDEGSATSCTSPGAPGMPGPPGPSSAMPSANEPAPAPLPSGVESGLGRLGAFVLGALGNGSAPGDAKRSQADGVEECALRLSDETSGAIDGGSHRQENIGYSLKAEPSRPREGDGTRSASRQCPVGPEGEASTATETGASGARMPAHAVRCPPGDAEVGIPGRRSPDGEGRAGRSRAVVYFYHVGPNGAPTRLTTASGRVVWACRYRAWGQAEVVCHEVESQLRLQGQYHDEESGLHYNRHRYYDPTMGGFASQDPLGLAAGLNPYRYAANAVTWADPTGLMPGIFDAYPGAVELSLGSAGEQAKFLANHVPGLTEAHATTILEAAFERDSSAVFGGSRVRGDFTSASDLDVGWGNLSERQAQRAIKKINKMDFDVKLEQLTIVPGKETATIRKIESPEEFFQRSGVRAGGDLKAGQPYRPSGSITATSDGKIRISPPGCRK